MIYKLDFSILLGTCVFPTVRFLDSLSCFYDVFGFLAGTSFEIIVDLYWQNAALLSFLSGSAFDLLGCSLKLGNFTQELEQNQYTDVQQWL